MALPKGTKKSKEKVSESLSHSSFYVRILRYMGNVVTKEVS